MDQPSAEVTQLLKAWCNGDRSALEKLALLVESELRRLARYHLSRKAGHTLQPTALVNEVYLRFMGWNMRDAQQGDMVRISEGHYRLAPQNSDQPLQRLTY